MMLLYAPVTTELELRAESDGSRVITGRFPYNSMATLSDGGRNGGRPKKEQFKPGAFRYSIEDDDQDIALLVGHDFDKPLASKKSKSLTFSDGDDALEFESRIPKGVAETSHGRDVLALIAAGLAVGVSPGFRIPPQSAVKDAVSTENEDPDKGNAIIRTISAAILVELSIVARPAYTNSDVEARSWNPRHSLFWGKDDTDPMMRRFLL